MELRQIRSFLSIAETLHFGRTAEMIHLSQPALSLQIRALEDEIGVRLFERNRRKTALTAAGVAFREDATGALLRLDQAVHKAKLAANGKLGILRIGFISTAGNEIVPTPARLFPRDPGLLLEQHGMKPLLSITECLRQAHANLPLEVQQGENFCR